MTMIELMQWMIYENMSMVTKILTSSLIYQEYQGIFENIFLINLGLLLDRC